MYVKTANGWEPLVHRNVTPAPDDEHWDSVKLMAGVIAYIAWLERENFEAKKFRSPKLFARFKTQQERMAKVRELVERGATEGERSAAQAALARLNK